MIPDLVPERIPYGIYSLGVGQVRMSSLNHIFSGMLLQSAPAYCLFLVNILTMTSLQRGS